MIDTDQYAQWDAAYVLGALSGGDRAEYEEHLAGCALCRAAVAELAGLPGLLGQLSPAEAIAVESGTHPVDGGAGPFADPFAVPDPPASLMPRLPLRSERRQRWLAPMAAAAAALLIGGVGGYAASVFRDATPGEPPASTSASLRSRLAFAPVSASSLTAVVDVIPIVQGTELKVECQYAPAAAATTSGATGAMGTGAMTSSSRTGSDGMTGAATGSGGMTPSGGMTGSSGTTTGSDAGEGSYAGTRYAIWVVGQDGRDMMVKDWTARSGRVMRPSGVTSWSVDQIESVEIRLADSGVTVLRAQLG